LVASTDLPQQQELDAFLQERLDSNSFYDIWYYLRNVIDYKGTVKKAGHGIYFIRSIYLSLIPLLLKLFITERAINLGVDKPNFTKSSSWKQSKDSREEIKNSFSGWGYQPEFKYVAASSFAFFEKEMSSRKALPPLDIAASRSTLRLVSSYMLFTVSQPSADFTLGW
jgi:hypothetical protein